MCQIDLYAAIYSGFFHILLKKKKREYFLLCIQALKKALGTFVPLCRLENVKKSCINFNVCG